MKSEKEKFLKLLSKEVKEKLKPRIVCVVGSTRFIEDIAIKQWEFETQGILVLGMHLLPMSYAKCEHHLAEKQGVVNIIDELHLRKIDLCDFVFVMNVNGYIGDRTKIEIDYAKGIGKSIEYLISPKN